MVKARVNKRNNATLEPEQLDVATLPKSVFLAPYVRMAKVRMAPEVIRQRISVDIQVKENDPVLDPIIDYLEAVGRGEDRPEPDLTEYKHLLGTVHSRMVEKGAFPLL
jgi:hypothetical protein